MASISASRRRRSSYNLLPHWLTVKRLVITLVAVVGIAVGTYGVRLAFGLAHAFHTNPISAILGALGGGNGSNVAQSRQRLQRINIMVYGYGGGGHDGAYLSDSMMLISINPQQSGPPQIAEISIPRDWYVPIELTQAKQRFGRLNEAYSDGMMGWGTEPGNQVTSGASVGDPTIEHLLGVHVDYFVGIDFSAFKQAVDSVGGVDVNVPNTFTDYQYPHGECDQGDCGYMTVHFNAGPQHMNGATALIFARSRHGDNGEGSDFARSRRQQLIVAALKSKVVSIGGIGNLPDLLNALGDNVLTNLTISDAEALYGMVKDVNPVTIEHVSLDDTNFLYDCGYPRNCGAYYLFAHDDTFQSVQRYIQNIFPAPAVVSQKAPLTFFDASGRGLNASTRWSQLAAMLGLKTSDGGRAPRQALTEVIDESGGKDAQTAKWLASYFGVTVTTQAVQPAASGPAAAGGVVVVLGSDEEQAFAGSPGVGS
ncbi:MAG: LCP family protein [Candidatus Dormibacteraeota bacterium]|nr:LCP family protein [Candidatus Dormibacteraeota bacterium]MBV9526710.1 LCP family protein [Candidatus Dormibacteraeota bacterium]